MNEPHRVYIIKLLQIDNTVAAGFHANEGFLFSHVERLYMPIFCDNCGHQNRDTATFCKGCGGKIIATTTNGTLQTGVILNKNYEIKNLIKQGGMGAVYQAFNRKFDTACAVKELLNQAVNPKDKQYMIDSFEREAKILHKLRHPNIPVVIDYFIEAGRYYLVMDYIEGKDFDTVMASYHGNIVPENTVIEWALEILDALNYLHSQNPPIIYRDMKPANIMLRASDKKVILIDFGIARTITPGGQTLKTKIGTPEFAPKELFHGQPEVRSDIYSLGGTLHCLLTGKFPLAPFDFKPLRTHNPKVSEGLERVVMKALATDLKDRYGSAKEMKEAILKLSSLLQKGIKLQPVVLPPKTTQFVTSSKAEPFIEPEMMYINGGTFLMGSNEEYAAKPIHSVTVEDFSMGKYVVTNKEFVLFLNAKGNLREGDTEWFRKESDDYCGIRNSGAGSFKVKSGYENHPVVYVSWYGAMAYCKWLSEKTGKSYRLPTEEEWEYACRADSTTEYYWGDSIDGSYCWYCDNSGWKIHPVGQRNPNDFGLYDMIGNVWEWCSDWYESCLSGGSKPACPKPGVARVKRGGGCLDHARKPCRSAERGFDRPIACFEDIGFRLAMSAQ